MIEKRDSSGFHIGFMKSIHLLDVADSAPECSRMFLEVAYGAQPETAAHMTLGSKDVILDVSADS